MKIFVSPTTTIACTTNANLTFLRLIYVRQVKSYAIAIFLTLINLFFGSNLLAQIASPLSNEMDIAYNGHRVQVSNIQAVKRTAKSLKFKCTVTNTGLRPLFLGKYRKHDTLPLVVIDTAELNTNNIAPYYTSITQQVLQVPVILQIGQTIVGAPIEIKYEETVKQNYLPTPNANNPATLLPPLAAQDKTPKPEEETAKPFETNENQLETHKNQFNEPATFANRTADTLKPIAQIDSTNILPPSVTQTTTTKIAEKVVEKPQENAQEKPPKKEKKKDKERDTPPKIETPKTEKNTEKNVELATKKEVELPKDTIMPPPVVVATASPVADSTACPDLTIDAVRILETTPKYVKLEFIVFNKGNAPVNLWGATRKLEDNVAVQFYANGTPRLTRGSLIIDGIYIQDGLKETKGILAPNKGVKQVAKVATEKITRYNRVIILRIDGFDVVSECDETNNTNSIVPDL